MSDLFNPPPGTFNTPSEFYDETLRRIESLAALKAAMFVFRQTTGEGRWGIIDPLAKIAAAIQLPEADTREGLLELQRLGVIRLYHEVTQPEIDWQAELIILLNYGEARDLIAAIERDGMSFWDIHDHAQAVDERFLAQRRAEEGASREG
jgi:hypothetical protein